MIFINFKTYKQGTGEKAVELAKICQRVSQKTSIPIFPCVQAVDIFPLSQKGFEAWAQHVDDLSFGPHTGHVLPQAIIAAGARGTLLNHSECKLPAEVIGTTIKKLQKAKTPKSQNFKVLVCTESLREAKEIVQFRPDLIAYEPPEFIGSRATSVSTAKPEVIKDFVKKIKNIPILVGAGIHSQEDVKIALKLGAVGILVATDVVKARKPKEELEDLAEGFK